MPTPHFKTRIPQVCSVPTTCQLLEVKLTDPSLSQAKRNYVWAPVIRPAAQGSQSAETAPPCLSKGTPNGEPPRSWWDGRKAAIKSFSVRKSAPRRKYKSTVGLLHKLRARSNPHLGRGRPQNEQYAAVVFRVVVGSFIITKKA